MALVVIVAAVPLALERAHRASSPEEESACLMSLRTQLSESTMAAADADAMRTGGGLVRCAAELRSARAVTDAMGDLQLI